MNYFSIYSNFGKIELKHCVGSDGILQPNKPEQFSCIGYISGGDECGLKNVIWSDVPDFDLLVGSFPCEAFGKPSEGLGSYETGGAVFYEIVRCVRDRKPSVILLENRREVLSHREGETFAAILTTLDELGYDLQWQGYNDRLFIVGQYRGSCAKEVFPVILNEGEDVVTVIMSKIFPIVYDYDIEKMGDLK